MNRVMENIARIAFHAREALSESMHRSRANARCIVHFKAAGGLPLARRPEAAVKRLDRVLTNPPLRLGDHGRDSGEVVLAERAGAL